MTKTEANAIVKQELGNNYKLWFSKGLYYLGYTVNRNTFNEFSCSAGYQALLSVAAVKYPNLLFAAYSKKAIKAC
jgi:hypothetical protein